MLNAPILLQVIILMTLFFYAATINIITLWYMTLLYLVCLGLFMFLDDGDIFVGFLWVIDLGVALIFFIFILHYSQLLHSKSETDKVSKTLISSFVLLFFVLFFFYFLSNPTDSVYSRGFCKTWFFLISWYDYYDFFFSHIVTDLNLLREIYFFNNSLEFFLINFLLFYGIISAILLCFLVKRIFNFLNYSQLMNYDMLTKVNSTYFIRNQNYLKQQSTSTGTRAWIKKKYDKL